MPARRRDRFDFYLLFACPHIANVSPLCLIDTCDARPNNLQVWGGEGVSPQRQSPHIVKTPSTPARLERHARPCVARIVRDDLARGLHPEEIVRHDPISSWPKCVGSWSTIPVPADEIDGEIQAELTRSNETPTRTPARSLGSNSTATAATDRRLSQRQPTCRIPAPECRPLFFAHKAPNK